MKMRKSTLAATVTAALTTLVVAAPAAANIYGTSFLHIDNTVITPLNGDGSLAAIGTFNFNTTNTAFLNGAGGATNDTCSGTFSGAHNCGPAGDRLDALPANAPGGDVARVNNVFNFFGPGGSQYSNSDSWVPNAQLTGDGFTETMMIAESELQTGSSAAASSIIQSATGLSFQFSVLGSGSLTLSFDADPFLLALINEGGVPGNYASQTDMSAEFTLSRDAGGELVQWSPQGTAANDCTSIVALCTEIADSEDLNQTLGVTTDGNQVSSGTLGNFTAFGISITGLQEGNYTLTLAVNTSTNLTRQPIPEPATLALFGIGLVGLGLGAIRRRKQA